jgi:hypothetical protein
MGWSAKARQHASRLVLMAKARLSRCLAGENMNLTARKGGREIKSKQESTSWRGAVFKVPPSLDVEAVCLGPQATLKQ